MNRNEARWLFLKCVSQLVALADKKDIPFIITEYDRSDKEQQILRAQGKTWTTHSAHQDWLAVDVGILDPTRSVVDWSSPFYRTLGEAWKSLNPLCEWGGDWKQRDSCHFGFRLGGWRELKDEKTKG